MDFTKLLEEQDFLIKGGAALHMSHTATLAEAANALNDQGEDLVYLLSDLVEDDLEELDDALTEAARGMVAFGEALKPLVGATRLVGHSNHPEMHKIVRLLNQVRENTGDVAQIFASLKKATVATVESRNGGKPKRPR